MTLDELKQSKMPHEIAFVICLKCYKRWLAVYPADALLEDFECPQCGKTGYVIKTGQSLPEQKPCDDCDLNIDGECKLGLSMTDVWCEFKRVKRGKE